MPQNIVEENIEAFFKAMMDSQCARNESWKYAVRRCISDCENYVGDLLHLPEWLSNGLIVPLMDQEIVKLSDLKWYNEEEKDDLFDVTGQFKLAALILNAQLAKGKPAD